MISISYEGFTQSGNFEPRGIDKARADTAARGPPETHRTPKFVVVQLWRKGDSRIRVIRSGGNLASNYRVPIIELGRGREGDARSSTPLS